jgi:hypothetical protein
VDKARAYAQATEGIDRMTNDRQVTPEGMREARLLLQKTGQPERWIEVSARIAKVVNRGELTLDRALARAASQTPFLSRRREVLE